MHHEFTIGDLNHYLDLFDVLGLTVWIDGGWGVDALLGEQTRTHADLDIVISASDAAVLRATLFSRGFFDVPTGDHSDWNYVMGNADGKNIDFHVIEMAEGGRGIYGPPEHGVFFPAESLKAIGRIDGRHVRCLSAKFQVHSHTGYELKPKDFADIGALHRKFGIPLPPEYRDLLPDRLDPG